MAKVIPGRIVRLAALVTISSGGALFGQIASVSHLLCTPTSVESGEATTCTVILSGAAPATGTEVLLSSNDSLLPVSANSVTVPAGTTSTTFTATAGIVSTNPNVTLTATALNAVSLSWTASTSSNVTYYNVYRGVTSSGPYTLVRNVGLVTSFVDNNIQNGLSYYYVTTAVDGAGEESAYSNQASAAVPGGVSQTAIVSLVAPPTVSSVSPNSGSTAGGTAVTITGANFASGATVTFGGTAATSVVVTSSTSITATTPAHRAGAATVTVTVSGQSGSLTNGYTYPWRVLRR